MKFYPALTPPFNFSSSMSEACQHFQAEIEAQLGALEKTWAMMIVAEKEEEKKVVEKRAWHEAEEQERLRKEVEKKAEEEHCEKKHWEAKKNAKR